MASSATAREAHVPAIIAGFPTQVEAYDLEAFTVGLVTVRNLEQQVDRERLLHDETSVPPYWAIVWGGARALASHLATRLHCDGRTVLDVGCGLGLVTLAAARAGARVTAIDRELAPIEFLLASAAVNRTQVEALVGDITSARFAHRFDLVLAADLLYERAEFANLARALAGQVASTGTLWVADPQRVDTSTFYQALDREGFTIREVCVSEVREESALLRVRLIALQRAGT
jgi:predicted nicotinamide N-methyase